jgi:toxin secretion/phage lysis holin
MSNINLQDITFSHSYWLFLLPLICAGADIVTGWIQATVNGTWDSTKMRKGLYRKAGELLVVVLSYVICKALIIPMDVTSGVSAYIVIMELVSVLENLDQAGVPIPVFVTKNLKKVADSANEDDTPKEGTK